MDGDEVLGCGDEDGAGHGGGAEGEGGSDIEVAECLEFLLVLVSKEQYLCITYSFEECTCGAALSSSFPHD